MKRAIRPFELGFYIVFILAFIGILAYFLGIQPLLGAPNQMSVWICICLACGGMLMMAVYNSALRLFTRSEKAALYFSLFCIGQCVRFFFMDGSIGIALFPALPPLIIQFGLRYFPFCISMLGLIQFVYEIYGKGRSKKIKYAVAAAMIAVNIIIPLSGNDFTIGRTIIGLPVGLLFITTCIVVLIKSPEFKNNPLSKLYLIGFLLYFISFFITATSIKNAPYIAVMFNFIFAIIHSILLSDRFARALKAVEQANVRLEEKVAERTEELTKANSSLAASERSVREMVQNISHDLKTPMSVLSVNLEMMQEEDPASEAFRRHMNIARNKSADLAQLIARLFEATRMEPDNAAYELTALSVTSLLNGVQKKYGDQAEAAGINLNISYRQDCAVLVDEKQIWSVVDNLLGNAFRYTPPGGTISIAAEEEKDGFVRITIADTGCGIEQKHLPRIFDRYYKADKARGKDGAGLGLYIVKTAVEAMGGGIVVESEVGKGTKMTFKVSAGIP